MGKFVQLLFVFGLIALVIKHCHPLSSIESMSGHDGGKSCLIKGNINRSGERIYHVPGQKWYSRTRIDESFGERWFCTEKEAREAGWRKAYE